MKAVNLLPPEDRRKAGFGGRTPAVIAAVLALVALMGLWAYTAKHGAASARQDLVAAEATASELEAKLGAYREAEARFTQQRLRRGAVVAIAAGRVNWERIIRDLAIVLPSQVWLTDLTAEAPEPGTAAAPPTGVETVPRGVHIEGYAYRQPQVARLMARARTVVGLGEPRLAVSEDALIGGREVVKFAIDIPIDRRAQDRPTLVPAALPDETSPEAP